MPNVPGKGVWGRPDGAGIGAATEMTEGGATLPGTTAPLGITQVWIGGPTGTPVLVWSSVATPPTGASAAFSAPTQVTVSWVPAAILAADSYLIKRPDGSIAGTAAGGSTTSFIDTEPRPLNGSYTVTAQLGSVSAAPVATNSLTLAPGPASINASEAQPGQVTVTWTHPAYGQPDLYLVYIDGAYIGPLGGNVTSWVTSASPGVWRNYTIGTQMGGVNGGQATDAGYAAPASMAAPSSVTGYSLGTDVIIDWTSVAQPAGSTFRIETYTPDYGGPWLPLVDNLPYYQRQYTFGVSGSGPAIYVRVRSEWLGVVSAWTQSALIDT